MERCCILYACEGDQQYIHCPTTISHWTREPEDGTVKIWGDHSNGLVGIVKDVSPHFSVVLSVLHSHFHTRVAVKKNNVQGRLVWNGEDPTVVKIVDVSEPGHLEPGDTIVTTGYSAAFHPVILLEC